MKKIKIAQEFIHGPLWYCDEDGIEWGDKREFAAFVGDEELNEIADRINELFSSYYEFDSHDVACWFNHEQEKRTRKSCLTSFESLGKGSTS